MPIFYLPTILAAIVKYGPEAYTLFKAVDPIVQDVVKALTPVVQAHAVDGASVVDQVEDLLAKMGHPPMTDSDRAAIDDLDIARQAGGR